MCVSSDANGHRFFWNNLGFVLMNVPLQPMFVVCFAELICVSMDLWNYFTCCSWSDANVHRFFWNNSGFLLMKVPLQQCVCHFRAFLYSNIDRARRLLTVDPSKLAVHTCTWVTSRLDYCKSSGWRQRVTWGCLNGLSWFIPAGAVYNRLFSDTFRCILRTWMHPKTVWSPVHTSCECAFDVNLTSQPLFRRDIRKRVELNTTLWRQHSYRIPIRKKYEPVFSHKNSHTYRAQPRRQNG